jgi:integrase
MISYVRLVVYRGVLCFYYTRQMKSVRINLGISLKESFTESEIDKIKGQLSKSKYPSQLNPYRETIQKRQIELNAHVERFKTQHHRLPTVSEFNLIIQQKDNQLEADFFEVFKKFIAFKKKEFINTPTSIRDYNSFRNGFEDFTRYKKIKPTIFSITEEVLRDYYNFIQTKRPIGENWKTKGGLDGKTIRKRLGVIKTFYKWIDSEYGLSLQRDIYEILTTRKFKYQELTEEVRKVVLTLEQIKIIRELSLREGSPECKARDMFLVVLQTGMRFSDLITLNLSHIHLINGQYCIKRKAVKTKSKEYIVEINSNLLAILKKYDYNMNLMSNQKANEYIRNLLSKHPDFQILTNYTEEVDGKLTHIPMWKLITFHQGRRSFITNLLNQGFSVIEVMKRTDHVKVSTLEEYVIAKGPGEKNILSLFN